MLRISSLQHTAENPKLQPAYYRRRRCAIVSGETSFSKGPSDRTTKPDVAGCDLFIGAHCLLTLNFHPPLSSAEPPNRSHESRRWIETHPTE